METTVVNMRFQPYDVYIGRDPQKRFHFGNPFAEKNYGPDIIVVENRRIAVFNFERWLKGLAFVQHEPERRQWILDNLHLLHGKRIGCFCKPKACHGDVLLQMAEEATWKS